ncbi:MAG: hypothetical protein EHM41_13535 [Chloroflexi bacterium]|nr:MAG: hypothetical protein EHM41_13535 [Chloroflexota bacterium]
MERTVPSTASEEVELYLRTYYSLLRSTAEVQIRTLEEAHAGMKSLMHLKAREDSPDMSAFIYTLLRLPACIHDVNLVAMGQSLDVFQRDGLGNIEEWIPVAAVARRRKSFYNGAGTLASYIASRSDIDDIIPTLTAYQIEWNKFHNLLNRLPASFNLGDMDDNVSRDQDLADALLISWEDLQRLRVIWNGQFAKNIQQMASSERRIHIKLLSGSLSEYRRATNKWWENIENRCRELRNRPIYFVSSNTHSLANLLSGFAIRHKDALVEFLHNSDNIGLFNEWEKIRTRRVRSSLENFLYYVLKKYENTLGADSLIQKMRQEEKEEGFLRVPSKHHFDVEAQVFDLSRINYSNIDPRLKIGDDLSYLSHSDAMILNIDYPLGLSAYNILSKVSESVGKVLGVYSVGKAASLNAVIGDVMIPNVIHDEHSQNTYLFGNSFSAADVVPYLSFGTVLDNQKAVSVLGTFLQNYHYMDVFYREGYTDIEMEAGPYLSAVYEMYRPARHPVNEIINFYGVGFDVGIIHYASDTPLGKGSNLGAGSLSYYGMDSTYASTLAVLRRIFRLEKERLARS